MNRSSLHRTSGLALLKIMLVVSIVILSVGVALYKFKGVLVPGCRISVPRDNIATMSLALVTYREFGGTYPTTKQGLQALVIRPASDPVPAAWTQLMLGIPKDPWTNDYRYAQPGKHNPNSFDLYSIGPDKKPGTKDDIGNWRRE